MDPIHILLIEDNEGDIILTKDAFENGKILNKISVVKDGKEAIDYLTKKEDYINAELPDILLLDINLPKKNGHEVLQFVKNHQDLKQIPVIMLSTSSSEIDINLSSKYQANSYLTKPVEVDTFIDAISKIDNFWISIVKSPYKNHN